jgi:hypothetical protein
MDVSDKMTIDRKEQKRETCYADPKVGQKQENVALFCKQSAAFFYRIN